MAFSLGMASGLLHPLFGALHRQLDQAGLILRRGTMMSGFKFESAWNATIIETTAAIPRNFLPPHPSREGTSDAKISDPDAAFTRKQGKLGSGLVHKIITTPTNINDTTSADLLIYGDERAELADPAYLTKTRERALKDRGIKPRLMRRSS